MTTEEKATLLSGNGWWGTHPVDRLKVPSISMTDGPHGIRKSQSGTISSGVDATCFPTASALASSWNENLVGRVGEALGKEARAYDVHILLGPGINMKRSPLGGRNFEYFSEDPVLAGKLAAAYIRGVQSQGVGTSLKHFAVNNQEFERMLNSSNLDERTLHEIYLRAFEIAVGEAKPWCVMCAYNKINGIHAAENEELLKNILREKWGFSGFVMSDWGAVNNRVSGVKAGLNLEMPGSGRFNRDKIIEAVNKGELAEEILDRVAQELLTIVLHSATQFKPAPGFDIEKHHELARVAAGESIVLLKNERNILPIQLKKTKKIALIGRFAKEPRYQGAGSSQVKPTKVSAAYDELVKLAGDESRFSYAPGYDDEGNTTKALLNEARAVAKSAEVAIVFAGLPDSYESEGFDRQSLEMPAGHNDLIAAVAKVQPNVVVVLMNGAAVTMPWLDRVQGVLEAWLGGQANGGAIADVLVGKINPSGKLSETFPQRVEDTPTGTDFPGLDGNAYYGERLFIGYRHYDTRKIEPLFPFGFGLSYTRFAYEEIKLSAATMDAKESLTVEVKVRNIGRVAGKEVVQLYVHEVQPRVMRPEKELKAFAKVELKPGEQAKVKFVLNARDFAHYDVACHDWIVNPGQFEIRVGGSSRDLPLKKVVGVKSALPPRRLTRESMLKEFRDHPRGKAYYGELLAATGMDVREPDPAELSRLTPGERSERKKVHAMTMSFLNDFPVGKLPAWSEGRFSEAQLEKLLKKVG
ncbi:MAG: glycoside hydrolase family 3 C-terminal domain-containing protein [Verrucomicrobia bacterium]|nr:glycoside hydrolase family 3 C-terminal domain-containing protein [Verrucomicrobiota bacterium]